MIDMSEPTTFVQPRGTTLQPYWLYAGMAVAAVAFMPPLFAALFCAAMFVPKLLLPSRVSIGSEGLNLSAWIAETKVPWSSITSAEVVGSGWRQHIKMTSSAQSRPIILNIGLFSNRQAIAQAIADAAGHEHPIARAASEVAPD